jgi:pimeloyl-ACP methyl ester carboxylesterase
MPDMQATSNYITVENRELHYMEWGAGNTDTVIAWHGLARTGRDMDELAAHLAKRYRVICPDTIGRGLSQWSPLPEQEYCLAFYARLAEGLADALGIDKLYWVGTSMGGAIGIKLAAGAFASRIKRLVLNDIGPQIAETAVTRIRSYAGNPPEFDTVGKLEHYFRTIYKPYGWLSDAQWRRLTESSTRRRENGKVSPHYDPKMVLQFTLHPHDHEQWEEWDRITAPTLVLRGKDSDLLLPDVALAMTQRGPKARLVEFAGCGHAPALNVPGHLDLISGFLAGQS